MVGLRNRSIARAEGAGTRIDHQISDGPAAQAAADRREGRERYFNRHVTPERSVSSYRRMESLCLRLSTALAKPP
jgi:hypothetical protein